jgi:hypothetical protein
MAYDEGLAQRVREALGEMPGLVEKKMFGGVGFMLEGNIAHCKGRGRERSGSPVQSTYQAL